MCLWRQLTYGLSRLLNRRAAERDVSDEVEQYFEEASAAGMARGLSLEDAQRAARLELGNLGVVQEQMRMYGWENGVRNLAADLRYATHQLSANSGFTIVSAITLALGIGASTAIFSAVNPILFEPLPYPHSNRIMSIWSSYGGARSEIAFGTYRELRARSHSFDALAVFEPWQPTMTGGVHPERLDGQSVSASFFRVIGVAPLLGRNFHPNEQAYRGPKVAILSNNLWRQHFNSDQTIVGGQIKLDDDSYTIIGVMPRSFENVISPSAQIWTPLQYDSRQIATQFGTREWGNHLRLIGRLRPGTDRDQAAQELDQIARTRWPEFPRPRWASLAHGLIVDSLQDEVAHTAKPALLAVLGAVILVLTIACVNVINLVLARNARRRGEFAVRAALGASRLRILRQLITENSLLASIGGALATVVALVGVRALKVLIPSGLRRLDAIAVDNVVLIFELGITILIGLLTGFVSALYVSRAEPHLNLQESSRRATGGHSATRRALVVTEVALALILLVAAGLLLRSMRRLLTVDPGFKASNLLTMQVQTSGHQFDDLSTSPGIGSGKRRRFFEQALEAVRRVPGVKQAAFTSLLPLSDDPPVVGTYGAQFENDGPEDGHNVFRYSVGPDYCQTMGIPLRRGRFLDERDTATAPQAALISESLAKSQFPNQNPIGKRLHVGPRDRPWYTVVGVVGDVKQTSVAMNQPDAVYISTKQTWFADEALSFVIRTYENPAAVASAAKSAIWSVDKDQPIVRVTTMAELFTLSEAERHFVLILFEVFGLVALTLAAVGIYGVLSGSVTERTREIGVRAALGATRADILALVLGEGMRLITVGVAIGLLGAVVASRSLSTLLFGVSRLDLVTYLGVIALLGVVSAIACWTPAWRAARVDPCVTLRTE